MTLLARLPLPVLTRPLLFIAAYALVPMALILPVHGQIQKEPYQRELTPEQSITRREERIRKMEVEIQKANVEIAKLDEHNRNADMGYRRLKQQLEDPDTIFVYFPDLKIFVPQDRQELLEDLQLANWFWGRPFTTGWQPRSNEDAERMLQTVMQASDRWKRGLGAELLGQIKQYIENNRLKKVDLNNQIAKWNNDIAALRRDIATLDPTIIGTWDWFNHWTVEIKSGGSFAARNASGNEVGSGNWSGPAGGKYTLTWNHHPDNKTYVDTLKLEGGTLKGTNSVNLGMDPKYPYTFGTLISQPSTK
jgi:hypothetical protein